MWIGCDTGKQNHRKLGLWDAELFDYSAVYGSEFEMDKATRLEYGQTQMTHAMLFTGVDVVEGSPRRWRVENSYGSAVGDKGFFLMNDSWFDEYMFEIAAPRKYLSQDLLSALPNRTHRPPALGPDGRPGQVTSNRRETYAWRTPKFGNLEIIDLREAWSHEAHDFTPWLADNLDRPFGCYWHLPGVGKH